MRLFDSNIIIDALNRHQPAKDVLATVTTIAISRVSWIEVLAGATPGQRDATEAFLRGCHIIELDASVARRAADLRRRTRLKLPDAIVWATALETGRTLVTRDRKNFPGTSPDILIPYTK